MSTGLIILITIGYIIMIFVTRAILAKVYEDYDRSDPQYHILTFMSVFWPYIVAIVLIFGIVSFAIVFPLDMAWEWVQKKVKKK